MKKVIEGDFDKLTLLFERYKTKLFNYFFRMGSSIYDSEDMVQDVFYRVLKYRKNFKVTGEFRYWMFFIAHNVFKDYNKKNKKNNHIYDEMNNSSQNNEDSIESKIITEESKMELEKIISKLNKDEKELLILSKFQGLKYSEIAKIFNTSESNIKIRIFRTIKKLNKIYRNQKVNIA